MTLRFSQFIGYVTATIAFLLCSVSMVQAQAPSVTFEAEPLFLDANIEPGDSVSRTVTIANTGVAPEEVYVSVANVFSTGLGEVMELLVTAPGSSYFTGVFDNFFSAAPLPLGILAAGETKVFTFSASFPSSAGNEYQTKQLGFDLLIGFVGGEVVSDNPGGGGGGGGTNTLRIFNEEVASVVGSTATLNWNTNLNASTYLVCGVVSDTPLVLTNVAPLFGYDFTLPEADTDTKTHTAVLSGLDTGTYECRPAGRVGPTRPFTVGEALRFSIGPDGLVAGAATTAPLIGGFTSAPTGSVLGASGKGSFGGPTYDEWKAEEDALRAAKAASSTENTDQPVITSDTATASDTEEGVVESLQGTSWFWVLLLMVLVSGVLYWRRLARN